MLIIVRKNLVGKEGFQDISHYICELNIKKLWEKLM